MAYSRVKAEQLGGMILLEPGHKIIHDTVSRRLGEDSKPDPLDLRISDFDDALYHISASGQDRSIVTISINLKCIAKLRECGANAMLEEVYAGLVVDPEDGFDVSIQFDTKNLTDAPDVILKKAAELKRNIMGAPFDQAFRALERDEQASLPPVDVEYRTGERYFIIPKSDRVIVIYAVDVVDRTDAAIARIFLQEYTEAQRHVNNCPPVSFSKDPPLELREGGFDLGGFNGLGYISFAIFKSHVEGQKREKSVSTIVSFRNFLQYHIKASKSYMHSRMRRRVNTWLQVLNRAIPQREDEDKKKRTMGGKAFRRAEEKK